LTGLMNWGIIYIESENNMAILVDLQHVVIANLMRNLNGMGVKGKVDPDMLRHMIFNSLRAFNVKFHKKYGDMILCCDTHGKTWRRKVFPYYKKNRKKDRDSSPLDWNNLFETINTIIEELHTFSPYKVIAVDGAEADDIIAVLCNVHCEKEQVLIISGDKDFRQLQKSPNVDQYAPVKKKFEKENDPVTFLKEHIMAGDKSDGVPNFLSDDDTFVTEGKRQKSLPKAKLANWASAEDPTSFLNGFTDAQLRGYARNEELIDFTRMPVTLREEILNKYDATENASKQNLMMYFASHQMKYMIERITEF
jgi:hypothetical protein